ncbi:RCC1 domain-containing protein [Hymenobacter chitinivorans]|uniref:Putative secreted protein (Por secretion system target) n=1 Tax=Hymenobacter chitinivorans DSM 11115 TaxID=1121954 RepID=A0A2M9B9V7_9BACT|nr:T9SS type A sorting domain-containing protein [Hymenobacter chitinivorans]PJJ54726.1 putative secreted protein (Por secretion system target) [Hymenobacter chitinivorans DSM 11115]
MKHKYFLRGCLVWCLALRAGSGMAQTPTTSPFVAVDGSVATYYTMALRADGSLWSWGINRDGQLGYPTTTEISPTPQEVKILAATGPRTVWTQVTAGANTAFALRSDGSLWAWGTNYGRYGNGNQTSPGGTSPTAIPHPATAAAGTVWTQVEAGSVHTLASRSDNTLWAWGSNSSGALGDGSGLSQSAPILIPTPTGAAPGTRWTQLSCGSSYSMALRSDGTLWGWGENYFGALGVSTNQNSFTPVPITQIPAPAGAAAGTTWTRVVAGNDHTLAMRSDGSLWVWGNSGSTNLAMQRVAVPATAPASAQWVDFAAGYIFSGALLSDGTLWTWGSNLDGQLGLNSTTFQSTPRQEFTRSRWTKVTMGSSFTLALDPQGLVYGSGYNVQGSLGDGTTINRLTFKPSLAPVLAATAPRLLLAPQPTPNPAHDYLTLPDVAPTATLRLHDTQGRLMREARPVAGTVDVRGLAPGLYLLTVQEPGHTSRAARVVLE